MTRSQLLPVEVAIAAALAWFCSVAGALRAQQPRAATDEANDPAALRQLKAAAKFFQQGQYEFAAETYREFLDQYPDHPEAEEARFFLAESFMLLKRYNAAYEAYQAYLKRHPEGRYLPWARFRLGEAAFLGEKWQQAIDHLRHYTANHPGHRMVPYAERYIGEALVRLGKKDQAEAQLRAVIRRYPKLPVTDHARYALAQLLEARGNRDEALQFYLTVGQGNSPVADDALLAAGTIEYDAARYAHAQKLFETLLQRFPQSKLRWTAHFNAGLSLYRQKAYTAAEGHFLLVAGAKANDDLALEAGYWLGRCLAERGKPEEAARRLADVARRAREADKADLAARALFESARSLSRAGESEAAVERYLAVADQFPEHELAEQAFAQAVFTAARRPDAERVLALVPAYLKRFPEGTRRGAVALAGIRAALAERKPAAARQWIALAARDADRGIARTAAYYSALIDADEGNYEAALRTLDRLLAQPETARTLPEAYFLAGRCAFQLDRYEDALKAFAVFLQAGPEAELAAHARAYRAVCLAHLGQIAPVKKELDALAEAPDVRVPATLAAADAFYDADRFAEAAELYSRIVDDPQAEDDDRAYALAGRAWARFYADVPADALADAQQFLQHYAAHKLAAEMLLLSGFAHKRAGQLEQALSAFAQVAARYPDSELAVDALLARARLLVEADRPADALATYADAIKILESGQAAAGTARSRDTDGRDLATVLSEYAWALWKAGRVDEAIAQYRRLIERFPQSPAVPQAELNLAQLLLDQNDPQTLAEAVALATKHRQSRDPQLRAEALFQLARAALVQSQWSQLEELCRTYLNEASDGPRAAQMRYMLVEALYELNKADELEEAVERALAAADEDAPWRGRLLLRKAQLSIAARRWQEAIEVLEPLLAEESNSLRPAAEYYKGRALYGSGAFDQAIEAFRHALAAPEPELAARAQFMIGEALFAQRKYRQAIREFLKVDLVYDVARWRAAALVEAAKCYEQLKEPTAARELYQRVVNEFPDQPARKEAETRLRALSRTSEKPQGTG